MNLLDLPPELLSLILFQIGPTQLRKSVSYLLISRAWYRTAHQIFLSDLHLSTLFLSSHDLERLPPEGSPLSNLIQANTTRLSLRLVGHPSKRIAKRPWHSEVLKLEGEDDSADERDDWTAAVPVIARGCKSTNHGCPKPELPLLVWRKRVNSKLVESSGWLSTFKCLEELSFEASSECQEFAGLRWDYIFGEPMKSVVNSLPVGLKYLTLDTCGSTIITSKKDRKPAHVCPLIAQRMHDFQHVRIRMRHICPQILQNLATSGTNSSLQSLVIRLSLPYFPSTSDGRSEGMTDFDAKSCTKHAPVYKAMIEAGTAFARATPQLKVLRISYRDPQYSGINLVLADCVNGRYMYEGSEIFYYEDDGKEWDAWEGSETLQIGQPL